jgi:nucleotide-binding universal stress UspA family protein
LRQVEIFYKLKEEVEMFKNILVAVDGSEHGRKAAQTAGGMARLTQADLWVVVAYDPLPDYLGQPHLQAAISERIAYTDQILAASLEALGEIPGPIHKEVLEGPPAEAILSVAETRNVDLIIMGTRGLGRLAGLLIGSQSQKVVAQANCPVMLVR